MQEILDILIKDARRTPEDIAKMTGKSVASVKKEVKALEKNGTIVQYTTVVNQDMVDGDATRVRALIEVGVTPQKDLGFDQVAERIYKFPEVVSCYLLSGSYDLLLVVEGEDIQTVSNFVSSKLSPMENVRQTTTHFLLKKYKENGQIFKKAKKTKRLNISY